MECNDCPFQHIIKRLEKDVDQLKLENSNSHNAIYQRLNNLENNNSVVNEKLKNIADALVEIKQSLEEMKKSKNEWVKYIAVAFLGAVGTFIATYLMNGIFK